jgi:hypothetical protein
MIEKTASRTLSVTGRVAGVSGATRRRPFAAPVMIRIA